MEALITILLILLFVGFIFRHLGRFILPFIARRLAKRFGMDPNAFSRKPPQQKPTQPDEPEKIIPDGVGEYVDYEEVK